MPLQHYESTDLQLLPHIRMGICKAPWHERSVLGVSDVSWLRSGELIALGSKLIIFKNKNEIRSLRPGNIREARICTRNKGLAGEASAWSHGLGCRAGGPEQPSAISRAEGIPAPWVRLQKALTARPQSLYKSLKIGVPPKSWCQIT